MKAKTTAAARKPDPKYQCLKMALVPVLLLVLAYVLFSPADESVSDSASADGITMGSPAATNFSNEQPDAGAVAQADQPATTHTWPEATLDFLTTSNPFESLEVQAAEPTDQRFVSATAEPVFDEVDQLANVASDLERRPVNFVFRSNKQNVIMLGDEVLEKGSHLSPAVQLHDIGDQTLLLKLRP